MFAEVARKLFTVDEYHRMAQAGILKEDDRVELIEGEIIEMSPIGAQHAACGKRCAEFLFSYSKQRYTVSIQDPVYIDSLSQPVPDLALLRRRPDYYGTRHPKPGDVMLIIEVMDTSALFDRTQKLPLYSRAGIPEVWLIDLNDHRIEVHAEPRAGAYQHRADFNAEGMIRSVTLDLNVDAGRLLR